MNDRAAMMMASEKASTTSSGSEWLGRVEALKGCLGGSNNGERWQ